MQTLLKQLSSQLESFAANGAEALQNVLSQDVHHIVITGLSRSGKSMFFTSLMTLLQQRATQTFDSLPLLASLPKSMIQAVKLRPIPGEKGFPLEQSLQQLEAQAWPDSTEEIFGFELVIILQKHHLFSHLMNWKSQVVFRFYDYPGEWLTDLPLLNKNFVDWSHSAWSQQMNPPQTFFAKDWHRFVENFNFDVPPDQTNVWRYICVYRAFLKRAKSNGITLLQPGSMLIPSNKFDWQNSGFAPLPSRISSDPEHPWLQCFQKNYIQFQTNWLQPLQTTYFAKADKQIVMLDLHEGLAHSRDHLNQLKETLSNLSGSFVYGANKWYKPKALMKQKVSKVAFVASKVDLIPVCQQTHFLHLLQDITAGVRAHLKQQEVEFQHFLVSSIQTTDAGSCANCLRFINLQNDYEEWEFEPLPDSLKSLARNQNYPAIQAKVPKDYLARMYHAQGIDRLIDYLIH